MIVGSIIRVVQGGLVTIGVRTAKWVSQLIADVADVADVVGGTVVAAFYPDNNYYDDRSQ